VEQLVTEDLCTSVAELDDRGYENLYAGWDIARHKDLSVIWVVEKLGDVTVTRGVIELTKMPTPAQTREAEALLARRADGRRPIVFRMSMDTGSMGLAMYESLLQKFGHGQVEGVSFTLANKENMAVHTKRRMEQYKTRIPDTDAIRNSFRLVKKTATATGQARFDSEHDAKYGQRTHRALPDRSRSHQSTPYQSSCTSGIPDPRRSLDSAGRRPDAGNTPAKSCVWSSRHKSSSAVQTY
jgi:phage FluMu gp28-like protein